MHCKISSISALMPRPATSVLLHSSAQLRGPGRVRVAMEAVHTVDSVWSEITSLKGGGF